MKGCPLAASLQRGPAGGGDTAPAFGRAAGGGRSGTGPHSGLSRRASERPHAGPAPREWPAWPGWPGRKRLLRLPRSNPGLGAQPRSRVLPASTRRGRHSPKQTAQEAWKASVCSSSLFSHGGGRGFAPEFQNARDYRVTRVFSECMKVPHPRFLFPHLRARAGQRTL